MCAGCGVQHPALYVMLALVLSLVLLLPRLLEYNILYHACLAPGAANRSSSLCLPAGQEVQGRPGLLTSAPWATYVLLTELGVTLLPATAMLALNIHALRRLGSGIVQKITGINGFYWFF